MNNYGSMNEMWSSACRDLSNEGVKHKSRTGDTVEIVGWSGRLENIDNNLLLCQTRRLDPTYACAELLWYLSGERSVKMMCAYAPSYKRFANPPTENGSAMGAYGDRWKNNPGFVLMQDSIQNILGFDFKDQMEAAVTLLEMKPDTRQAVVTMWDSGDICEAVIGQAKDLPCTLSMQFIRREKILHCSVCMRSNDVWLGMPYDVFCFTSIQRMMARRLGLYAGTYVHSVGSLHAYTRDFDKGLDLGKLGRWHDDPWSHGYNDDDFSPQQNRAWSVEDALTIERDNRENGKLHNVDFAPGGPVGDAALMCAVGLLKRRDGVDMKLDERLSPALRQAWKLKHGDK